MKRKEKKKQHPCRYSAAVIYRSICIESINTHYRLPANLDLHFSFALDALETRACADVLLNREHMIKGDTMGHKCINNPPLHICQGCIFIEICSRTDEAHLWKAQRGKPAAQLSSSRLSGNVCHLDTLSAECDVTPVGNFVHLKRTAVHSRLNPTSLGKHLDCVPTCTCTAYTVRRRFILPASLEMGLAPPRHQSRSDE